MILILNKDTKIHSKFLKIILLKLSFTEFITSPPDPLSHVERGK